MAGETLLAWHRKLIAQKYDGFRKAPDEAFADRQRDRSLDRAHGGRIAAGARRCRLSCSKGAADSGRTTRHSEKVPDVRHAEPDFQGIGLVGEGSGLDRYRYQVLVGRNALAWYSAN
jgi:hypothetical protein